VVRVPLLAVSEIAVLLQLCPSLESEYVPTVEFEQRLTNASQPFWGEMIAAAGAGPMPIAFKSLNPQNLADAIKFCLTPRAVQAAAKISEMIVSETGVQSAVASFHRNLPHPALPCDVLPDQPAVWTYKGTKGKKKVVKLSKVAAESLIVSRQIKAYDLGMNESKPVFIEHRRWDPITGGASMMVSTVYDTSLALGAAMTKKGGLDFDDSDDARSKNLAKAGSSLLKGAVIDMPMALADGLRHAPRMYGDKGRDYGQITGITSGLSMAGKVNYVCTDSADQRKLIPMYRASHLVSTTVFLE
jgi:sterol 3beta-glucosyltransferase